MRAAILSWDAIVIAKRLVFIIGWVILTLAWGIEAAAPVTGQVLVFDSTIPGKVAAEDLVVTQELAVQTLAAGDTITIGTADRKSVRVKGVIGSGGAVTLTSNPQIAAGTNGQIIELYGTSAADTVTLVAGAGLLLCGEDAFVILSTHVGASFQYDATATVWEQRGCRATQGMDGTTTLEQARLAGNVVLGAISEATAFPILQGAAGETCRTWMASGGKVTQCRDAAGNPMNFGTQLATSREWALVNNAGSTIFRVQEAGGVQLYDHSLACSAANAGTKRYRVGAANVADMEMICTKLPDDAYYWVGPPEERHTTTGATDACEATPADDFFAGPASSATEALVQTQSRAGYYTRLRSRTQASIPTGQTMTVTLRKAGVNTALTCSQSNAQTCSGNQVVSFADGDLWNMLESCTTGGAATKLTVILLFYPS